MLIILILIGIIISFIIGMLWHNSKFWGGRIHFQYTGFAKLSEAEKEKVKEKFKPVMWKIFLAQILLSALMSTFIALVMIATTGYGISKYSVFWYVLFIWLCFLVPVLGGGVLWGVDREKKILWQKFFSDILYYALILGTTTLVFTFFF